MFDSIDVQILNMLQKDGRTKRSQLAEAVGLSIPSLSERLNKLEEKKIIQGYYAKVDKKVFGYDIMAFILVVMDSSKHYNELIKRVKNNPLI